MEQQAAQAERRLKYSEDSLAFHFAWVSLGHPVVTAFDAVSDFMAALDKGKSVFDKPFVVKSSDELALLLKRPAFKSDKNDGLLDKWSSKDGFLKRVEGGALDGVQHTMTAVQGAVEVRRMFSSIVPDTACIQELPVTALNDALGRSVLYGYSATYVRRSFESDFLGSLRAVTDGRLKIHLAHPGMLSAILRTDAFKGLAHDDFSPAGIARALRDVTEDMAKAWAAEKDSTLACPIWSTTLEIGQVLYVPPAWVSCVAAIGDKHVAGFRQLLLPACCDKSAVTAVKECSAPESDTLRTAGVLLNVMTTAAAKGIAADKGEDPSAATEAIEDGAGGSGDGAAEEAQAPPSPEPAPGKPSPGQKAKSGGGGGGRKRGVS